MAATSKIEITLKDLPVNRTYTGLMGGNEMPTGINGYTDSLGRGGGASFTVTKADGVYTSVVATATGAGYLPDDRITILGSKLGGEDGVNDLQIKINTIGSTGKIATFTTTGTAKYGDGDIDTVISIQGLDYPGVAHLDELKVNAQRSDFTFKVDAAKQEAVATSKLDENFQAQFKDWERVHFTDKSVALDVSNIDDTYAVVAAGFGKGNFDAQIMGQALWVADRSYLFIPLPGGPYVDYTYSARIVASALVHSPKFIAEAGGSGNESFVKYVYKNVTGQTVPVEDLNYLVKLLESGTTTKADLLVMASKLDFFQTSIDLVGVCAAGIDYIPYSG